MRRIAIGAALIGGVVVVAWVLVPKLHERMLAACKRMFEQMPEDFPPKRMLGGIEEIRENTARTLELLQRRPQPTEGEPVEEAFSAPMDEVELVHA